MKGRLETARKRLEAARKRLETAEIELRAMSRQEEAMPRQGSVRAGRCGARWGRGKVAEKAESTANDARPTMKRDKHVKTGDRRGRNLALRNLKGPEMGRNTGPSAAIRAAASS